MLTVKWVADNGSEMIYQASGDVSFTPADVRAQSALTSDQAKACVAFADQNGTHCTLDSGRIFVMNEAGRTVADYHLSSEAFPHGIAPKQAA